MSLNAIVLGDYRPTRMRVEDLPAVLERDVIKNLGLRVPPSDIPRGVDVGRWSASETSSDIKGSSDSKNANMTIQGRSTPSDGLSPDERFKTKSRSSSVGAVTKNLRLRHRRRLSFPIEPEGSSLGWRGGLEKAPSGTSDIILMGEGLYSTDGSDFGSEPVEVDGGVALTEEAVTHRYPDIVIST